MKSHQKNLNRLLLANLIMFAGLSMLILPRLEINLVQLITGIFTQGALICSVLQTIILL
jgi:hypothetical protein